MHEFLVRFVYYADLVFIAYFVAANLAYTCLMVLSLYSVSLHAKYAARKPYSELADSPVTPPVAIVIAAYNEENTILDTVLCVLGLNYREKEVIVVDDGSTDHTLAQLIERFSLKKMDFIYREELKTAEPVAFYHNPNVPQLLVISSEHRGKPHALNTGVNMARSPYFCTVDADCIIEKDALLRLMAPVLNAKEKIIVSGGIVRIANGCTLKDGRLEKIDLPKSWLELCQVVEYIRTFMFGRPGWNMLNATFIASGAFCVLHRATVVGSGGFRDDTVTEDIDMIAAMRRYLTEKKEKFRVVFTSDPICWTEAPRTLRMLARQRRRWQLGMAQTLWANRDMICNPKYGATGMVGMPFHLFIEVVGCVVEALGTIMIPLCLLVLHTPLWIFLLFLVLSIGYGTLLSMGSVVLEEITQGRYPKLRHVMVLMIYAVVENVGYRQIVTFFRAAGVLQAFRGRRRNRWELVEHRGVMVGAEGSNLTGSEA